jgi:hypothetical protein
VRFRWIEEIPEEPIHVYFGPPLLSKPILDDVHR